MAAAPGACTAGELAGPEEPGCTRAPERAVCTAAHPVEQVACTEPAALVCIQAVAVLDPMRTDLAAQMAEEYRLT